MTDDGAAEGGKGVGAGIACRDERRRALVGNELVAGDADGGARIDVGVQVDQAGRHELAGGRQQALRLVGGYVGRERLDQAEAHADVALGSEVLAGIEHLAALDERSNLSSGPMAASAAGPPSPMADSARAEVDPASLRNSRREVAGMAVSSTLILLDCGERAPVLEPDQGNAAHALQGDGRESTETAGRLAQR